MINIKQLSLIGIPKKCLWHNSLFARIDGQSMRMSDNCLRNATLFGHKYTTPDTKQTLDYDHNTVYIIGKQGYRGKTNLINAIYGGIQMRNFSTKDSLIYHIWSRFVHSYDGSHSSYDSIAPNNTGRHLVHMKGLPYKVTEAEVFQFFLPLRPTKVHIIFDDFGRATGGCDAEFATHNDALNAMNKDREYIQNRYVELFLRSNAPPMPTMSPEERSEPIAPNSTGQHKVHMRGLPFKTSDFEVYEFFRPLRPINVCLLFDGMGRLNGECDVEFATHGDALKAMGKHKAYIKNRYIELSLYSNETSD